MSDLNRAMINTLNVFNGHTTVEALIIAEEGWFVYNPEKKVTLKNLESMLQYFQNVEDYKRCEQVLKLIQDGKIIGKDFRL